MISGLSIVIPQSDNLLFVDLLSNQEYIKTVCLLSRGENQWLENHAAEMGERRDMIRKADMKNAEVLAALAIQLWPENDPRELAEDFRQLIDNEGTACFLKYVDNRPIAFAQCQLRYDYVEGTDSSPVGYLEGIFVTEGYRGKGYAAELVRECEKWAKEKGCTEFASDCGLDNDISLRFHMSVGLKETNRIICFRKDSQTCFCQTYIT